MKKLTKLLMFTVVLSGTISISYSECAHQRRVMSSQLSRLAASSNVFVEESAGVYRPYQLLKAYNKKSFYNVQVLDQVSETNTNGDFDAYNRKHVEYYTYPRMQKYLAALSSRVIAAGYEQRVVGKSIRGRDLYAITPVNLTNKKTIVMFGRHHGDEGTANWIIEGFVNEYFADANASFRDEYQLLLYPMINPDGAMAQTRYNANGRDLNRSWHAKASENFDEISDIHGDLKKILDKVNDKVVVALDMHGSFTEDFIYRVKKNYVSRDFYNLQQKFIDELGTMDPWQAGNFQLSNGDSRMARLVLVNHYKKNAMTHESIRNIKLNNRDRRSKADLIDQGLAVFKTVSHLY